MEPSITKLGGSLQVPNVQELVAKEHLTTLPPRYIRPDITSAATSGPSPEIPVIHFDSLLSGDEADSELLKLHQACKDWGFFQLIHHGVSSSLVEKLKLEVQEFFQLPMEEKKKFWQEPGDLEGFGQAFVVSEKQKLDWADLFYLVTLPSHTRKPHLFPNLPLPFRDAVEAYSLELKNLAMKILSLMAKALKMKDEDMTNLFEEGMQSMRMNYYPPCPQPELAIGLSPHSDAVGLTILLQVNEMEGLQIKKDGMWIPVAPLPGAFIVNIGDILEIVTNGIYRSIEHRATVNCEKERLSIATFLSPKLDGELGPAPSLITSENPTLFRRVLLEELKEVMEAKLEPVRSSLLVPCVQELVKESPTAVPPRYIQHDQDPQIESYHSLPDVPIIDMERLLSGDQMELKKLGSACKEWGFFQLINHGVSSALLEKLKLEIIEFFNLPMEEKKKFWQDPGDFEGFGQAFVLSEEQKLDWGDIFALTTLPTHLRKPRLFPKLPLPFRDTLDNYANELKHLAVKVLDFISMPLKMKTDEMRDFFQDGRQAMRMNYYPPCPQPEKVIGLTPHSDGAGLTILLQINEMEGLQIKKDGMWIPVKPHPKTFVVNIGDILEIVTNGAYRSIVHRAVVNSRKERLSIATFYSPGFGREIRPAPSMVAPQTPALFRGIGAPEYYKGLFARKLDGKSYLDAMRIENQSQDS